MTNEEKALDLIEQARSKVSRAARLAPELAGEFSDAIAAIEDLAEELEAGDEGDDGDE
jgi:hypothetical protein